MRSEGRETKECLGNKADITVVIGRQDKGGRQEKGSDSSR